MQHLWHNFGSYRKRINQDWLRQQKLLDKVQGLEMAPESDDDMGDINIKGDETHEHVHHHSPQSGLFGEVLKMALTAALGAGACWYFLGQPTDPTPTDKPEADWTLGLKVTDEP